MWKNYSHWAGFDWIPHVYKTFWESQISSSNDSMTAYYTVIMSHVQPKENFQSIRVAHMLLIYHFNFISESKLKKRKLWNSSKSSVARVMRSLAKKPQKQNKTKQKKPKKRLTHFRETSFGFRVLLQLFNSLADAAQVCRHLQ